MTKRIAVVIDPWDYPFNGTVVSTRRFVAALEARGWPVRVLAIGPGGNGGEPQPASAPRAGNERSSDAGDNRIAFRRLSIPGVNGIIDAMRAPLARPERELLRAALADCDLLHVQYPFFLGYAAIAEAQRQGLPTVASFHVQPENILLNLGLKSSFLNRVLYRLFIRAFYNRVDRVIAPSPFAAELLEQHGVSTPVTVISNGVPEVFFRTAACPRQGPPWQVLSVGRLASEKQQATLLAAVAACAHGAQIELTLAGAGPREPALRRLARRLKVNARIGPVSDEKLSVLYDRAHLFVHCGTIELEGMSVLEAMAAGKAVIVCDAPASASARFELPAAARFRVGDSNKLAERIDYWLGDVERREEAGRANRALAQHSSHARSVDQLIALYSKALGVPASQAADGEHGSADIP